MERICSCCNLLEEVLEEIFSWLPPKSLIRFKCVSKSWYKLINFIIKDKTFVNKHLHNIDHKMLTSISLVFCCISISYSYGLHHHSRLEHFPQKLFKSITVFFDDNDSNHINYIGEFLDLPTSPSEVVDNELRSHCDGIICLACGSSSTVTLCNPAIKECRTLPKPHLAYGGFKMLGVGFGYDSRANDYKVVRFGHDTFLRNGMEYFETKAEIYSLRSDSWREIGFELEFDYPPLLGKEVFCKGVFYWLVWNQNFIISFDIFDEVFHSIQLSNDLLVAWERHLMKLVVWNESVALFIYQQVRVVRNFIEVWVMNDCYGGVKDSCSWTKKLVIGPLVDIGIPITFLKNDELLMQTNGGRLILYNLRSQMLRKLTIFQAGNTIPYWNFTYVRSLVSVQGGSESHS